MNKDINKTLTALVPILNMNGEKVKSIECVRNWVTSDRGEYMDEIAEITYENGHKKYAAIGGDSNLCACLDTLAVIMSIRKPYETIERIERGVYD